MIKSVLKNKKGSVLDLFFIIVIIISFAIFLLLSNFVIKSINNRLLNSSINESDLAVATLNRSNNTLDTGFNYVFLVIFFGLILGMLISSALINVSKIFIPIYIIFFAFAIIIGVIMNNVYNKFRTNATLSAAASHMTFANAIIENYVLVLIAIGVLSLILIFGKVGGGERL